MRSHDSGLECRRACRHGPSPGRGFLAGLSLAVAVAVAAVGIAGGEPKDSLETFLVSQLRVRTPADTLFVERVAGAVLNGRLPETVVRGTCEWAVGKADRSGARYPFPYFRSAIVLKARRLGVEL